jgi:hypothetical protein
MVAVTQGVLIAITVAVLLVTFFISFPAVETRYFPVANPMTIDRVETASDGRSLVYVSFTKLRDCEYIGMSWYERGLLGTLEQVPIEVFRRPNDISSPSRPVGTHAAGPWIIGIPSEVVRSNSFVQLAHRCHPFWTTFTNFYP